MSLSEAFWGHPTYNHTLLHCLQLIYYVSHFITCLVLLQYKLYKGKAYRVCSLLRSWSLEEYLEHSRHSINTTLNEHMNEVARQTRPETASLRSKDSFNLVRQGRWYYWQQSGTLDRWNKFFYERCQVRFWTQKHLKYKWTNPVAIYYKAAGKLVI